MLVHPIMASWTKEIIGISVVVTVTMFFCMLHIKESPPVWYDEGIYIQAASNLADSGVAGFRVTPDMIVTVPQLSVGYPLLYPLALIFKIFGSGVLQARLLMSMFVIMLVVGAYILIRMTHGYTYALWAALLISLFPPLYGTGKSVLGEVPGTVFLILSLVFFAHAGISLPDGRKILRIAGAGLCAGLAMVTKPVFILIAPALFIVGILHWKRLRYSHQSLFVGVVALALPLLIWLVTQFTHSGSLVDTFAFYANPAHVGDVSVVVLRNIKNALTDMGPLLLLGILFVWAISFVIRVWNSVTIHITESILFIFCIISVAAFFRTAGYYRYLLPYQIIALSYFPYSLSVTLESLRRVLVPAYGQLDTVIVRSVLMLMLVAGIYQVLFSSWVADAYKYHRTAFWENYFSGDSLPLPIFYYDVPEVALFDQNRNYYQYINMAPAAGISVGPALLPLIELAVPASVIVETSVLKDIQGERFKKYRMIEEVEKYTILERLSL